MRKKKLKEKVLEYNRENHLIEEGDKIVLGVSGGADSVCLLFVLHELAPLLKINLCVVHINHLVRKEAYQDADYVSELCGKLKIPFYLEEIDIKKISSQEKCSIEEAGRRARYAAFDKIAKLENCNKIAVAHNSNDQAETLIFHLCRGTGLKGLCGIPKKREHIVRPLLAVSREEIEDYLEELNVSYQEDATNATDEYTRNKIRHHILPYMEEEIVSNAIAHISHTAELLSEVEDFLEIETKKKLKEIVVLNETEKIGIDIEKFREIHITLQKKIIIELIYLLAQKRRDLTNIHIEGVLSLIDKEGNRKINLPYGIKVHRQYKKLIIEKHKNAIENPLSDQVICLKDLNYEQEFIVYMEEFIVKFILIENENKMEELPKNQYTKWFDCDKIGKSLVLRTRKQGDFFCINVANEKKLAHQKIKDYFITKKIPKEMRDRIPLLAEENHILWIMGYRISEKYKINKETKCILQVQYLDANAKI